MPFIYGGIFISNCICAAKNKKYNTLLLVLTGIFFVFMFSGNSSSGDIPNYLYFFHNSSGIMQTSPISGFFYGIMALANNVGLNFFQFKIIIAVIIYILYFCFLSKFQCNMHYVVLFYMLHLFFFDVEQIRNALAIAIFLQGLVPLLKNEGNWKGKYILFTLLASLIHISFIVYLVFLLFEMTWNLTNRFIFMSLIIMLCIYTFLNGNRIPFLNYILTNFDILGKVDVYFGNKMHFGFLIPTFLHISMLLAVWYIRNTLIIAGENNRQIDVAYRLIILSFSFMPLYFLSITFGRLVRNLLPIVLLAGATIIFKTRPKSILRWKVTLTIFIMVLCWCIYDIFARPNDILIPLMQYNYFINGGVYYYY